MRISKLCHLLLALFFLSCLVFYSDYELYYSHMLRVAGEGLDFLTIAGQQNVQYAPGSVAIVTLVTPNFEHQYEAQVRNMRAYANRHNYTLLKFSGDERDVFRGSPYLASRYTASHWRKLLVINEALRRHEYVLFLDADVMISAPQLRVEDLFSLSRSIEVVFVGKPCIASSHFVAFRRGRTSEEFIKRWWRYRSRFRRTCHYDQGPFIYSMIEMTVESLYTTPEGTYAGPELGDCWKYVDGSPTNIKSPCKRYQRCLRDKCRQWIIPIKDGPMNHLRKNISSLQPFSMSELLEKTEQLPFTWNVAPWRSLGWDGHFDLSYQKPRRSVFKNCSAYFSVHPVKNVKQFKCS